MWNDSFSHNEGVVFNSPIALEEGITLIGGKYRLTAPNIDVEIKKKRYFTKRFFLNTEIRFLAGYPKPIIIDG